MSENLHPSDPSDNTPIRTRCKRDISSLRPGGAGGRKRYGWEDAFGDPWSLHDSDWSEDSDEDDVDETYKDEYSSDCGLEDYVESDGENVNESRSFVEVGNLCRVISENLVCKKCMERTRGTRAHKFLRYCREEEERIAKEESEKQFGSRLEKLEWRFSQQKTVQQMLGAFSAKYKHGLNPRLPKINWEVVHNGAACRITGRCTSKHPHVFEICPTMVNQSKQSTLHGNAKLKLYQVNYIIAGAMQRMGCGGIQLETLMSLLGFQPCNWRKFLTIMEPELGKVEVEARDRSMEEAVTEEIRLTTEKKKKWIIATSRGVKNYRY